MPHYFFCYVSSVVRILDFFLLLHPHTPLTIRCFWVPAGSWFFGEHGLQSLNPALALFSCSCSSARLRWRSRFVKLFESAEIKRNVLGSGLPSRATNPSWEGSNLWTAGQSSALAWRGANCGTRHGRHSFRQRHSLASRRR